MEDLKQLVNVVQTDLCRLLLWSSFLKHADASPGYAQIISDHEQTFQQPLRQQLQLQLQDLRPAFVLVHLTLVTAAAQEQWSSWSYRCFESLALEPKLLLAHAVSEQPIR